ncbi:hypothetical protein BKA62DRAFT_202132 [Auriculariales sp. MPI-PUGE-AT-0066]|nr:hypothetical protein BKA62DRAFT_202132 [Auriculariales sp. MPI-PUGE-AT-0066]
MGSAVVPPAHVPLWVIPFTDHCLEAAGLMWTIVYVSFVYTSLRDKTYGMPLIVLSSNMAWEFVYGVWVSEDPLEKIAFTSWFIVDIGLIYATLKHGRNEWSHAPFMQRHLFVVFGALCAVMVGFQYSFASWWIENRIGSDRGRTYRGITPGPDIKELNFWSATIAQALSGVAFLAQLLVRWDNRGHSWFVWTLRTFGTVIGLTVFYAVRWWYWPEAYGYFVNPFALWATIIGFVTDFAYGGLMLYIQHEQAAKGRHRRPEKTKQN